MNIADTDTLDKFQEFGEGRWGVTVRKPLDVFTGNTIADKNDAVAVNENARKPKSAKSAVCVMLDNLGLEAIIVDVRNSKKQVTAVISSSNPKRLDYRASWFQSGSAETRTSSASICSSDFSSVRRSRRNRARASSADVP
jgi:hypothetical protein